MSDVYQSLAHSKWDCKYHAIPPKHPIASVIGFLKGKSAIVIARLSGKERNFSGEHFWAPRLRGVHMGFEPEQVPIHPRAGCLGG